MKTLQQKFFAKLEDDVQGLGYEVVLEPNYANQGRAHIIMRCDFYTLLTIHYHFSAGHNTFTVIEKNGKETFMLIQHPPEMSKIFNFIFDILYKRNEETK